MWLVAGTLLVLALPAVIATLDAAQGSLETTQALLAVTCLSAALWLATTTWK
jgi:hypothetical protein